MLLTHWLLHSPLVLKTENMIIRSSSEDKFLKIIPLLSELGPEFTLSFYHSHGNKYIFWENPPDINPKDDSGEYCCS